MNRVHPAFQPLIDAIAPKEDTMGTERGEKTYTFMATFADGSRGRVYGQSIEDATELGEWAYGRAIVSIRPTTEQEDEDERGEFYRSNPDDDCPCGCEGDIESHHKGNHPYSPKPKERG